MNYDINSAITVVSYDVTSGNSEHFAGAAPLDQHVNATSPANAGVEQARSGGARGAIKWRYGYFTDLGWKDRPDLCGLSQLDGPSRQVWAS